jgi:16S rRNA (uracil1498-N3)-methyltransferase
MAEKSAKIRLYVDADLGEDREVILSRDQCHYLKVVMRREPGEQLKLFNGRDGEWLAKISNLGKRDGSATILTHLREQDLPPDLWLLFAPIKKARTDFIVEKAAELGVRRIQPVRTDFTNSERIRQDRLQAHAIEAAEQCESTHLAEVAELRPLDSILSDWGDRQLIFCDERRDALILGEKLQAGTPTAILIGPEGGFSDREVQMLRSKPFVTSASLGPRILRADTAAIAALSIWQAKLGDWAPRHR